MKQRLIATVAISIAFMALNFLFHGVILMDAYNETANLWRPMADMKNGVMNGGVVLTALIFTMIYCKTVSKKTQKNGIMLGALVGLLSGVMSASAYAYMPITTSIAMIWLVSEFVKFTVAGAIVGTVVTKEMN